MYFFATFLVVICVSSFEFAYGGGHGGGGPGLVLIQNNKQNSKRGDMIMFQSDCGPGIIKDGGRKGKNILVLPQCQKKKIIKKEVKYIGVPVKEYIPVPVMMKKGMGDMMGGMSEMGGMDDMGMGLESMQMQTAVMGGGMDSFGMETKKSVSHASDGEQRPAVRRVVKIRKPKTSTTPSQ